MKKNNVRNYIIYTVSAALSLVLAILIFLFWMEFLSSLNLAFPLICLMFLFSPLGDRLFKTAINYIRVFIVAGFAGLTAMLVGIAIPSGIGRYYDSKAALAPKWLYTLNIYSILTSIIIGFILAYMIFKKYYKKTGNVQ